MMSSTTDGLPCRFRLSGWSVTREITISVVTLTIAETTLILGATRDPYLDIWLILVVAVVASLGIGVTITRPPKTGQCESNMGRCPAEQDTTRWLPAARTVGVALCLSGPTPLWHGLLVVCLTVLMVATDNRHARRVRLLAEEKDRYWLASRSDGLTGLLNEVGFLSQAAVAVCRDRESGRSTHVAVVDIDRFKLVNDTFGHAAGDDVLKALALALGGTTMTDVYSPRLMRTTDIASRLHGDEFAVLLPNTSPAEAHAVMERFRRGVQELRIICGNNACDDPVVITVTVSVGLALVDTRKASEQAIRAALDRHADAALYLSKRSRNHVTQPPGDENAIGQSALCEPGHQLRDRPAPELAPQPDRTAVLT
jgi:diguanylate cyclase (GGDEF)-like protein